MIPLLSIPFYNRRDLLLRCVASIDYPVKQLLVVQNGKEDGTVEPNKFVENWTLIRHPNAGVAASWNEAIKFFPEDWWLLSNNDIQFSPGDLERMANAIAEGDGCYYGNHGASWFGVTKGAIKQVGLFDENIFPAYLEDCDWSTRADRLGVKRTTVQGCRAIHGDAKSCGSCTIMSDDAVRAKNHQTHGRNFQYYQRKWGGINGQETFQRPFNDPNWPMQHWVFDPDFRKEQM